MNETMLLAVNIMYKEIFYLRYYHSYIKIHIYCTVYEWPSGTKHEINLFLPIISLKTITVILHRTTYKHCNTAVFLHYPLLEPAQFISNCLACDFVTT
jgi:hypothetical protein